MSEPEVVTFHAARINGDGDLWIQTDPVGRSWRFVGSAGSALYELEREAGPTRLVRVATGDHTAQRCPADLTADQHIRIVAARLWIDDRGLPTNWTVGDWAGWIRDGEVPDAS